MHPTVVVKNLGVWLSCYFYFTDHVRNIFKTYFIQMHDHKQVRQYLMAEAANPFVSSFLDYCNCIFRRLCSFNMH